MGFLKVRDGLSTGDADTLAGMLDIVGLYPSKGIDSGQASGTVATWDGTGATPPGWTSHESIEHPTAGTYEVRMSALIVTAIGTDARRALLTSGELTTVDAHLAASSDTLDSAWDEIGA